MSIHAPNSVPPDIGGAEHGERAAIDNVRNDPEESTEGGTPLNAGSNKSNITY